MDKTGLIPAIIQDYNSREVLMLAYMNQESLKKSIETKTTWFWSRSRQKLWNKGETSGNYQTIKEIRYDCDGDALLFLVEQVGVACHTGHKSCFYRELGDSIRVQLNFKESGCNILDELYRVITKRIEQKTDSSYTYSLHRKGLDEILKKVTAEGTGVLFVSSELDEVINMSDRIIVLVNGRITKEIHSKDFDSHDITMAINKTIDSEEKEWSIN